MDLNAFISILSRLIPSEMHAKCQELELRHAELGLKEWCREFMDKLPKGATNWEWINNMGLGLGVNIWLH